MSAIDRDPAGATDTDDALDELWDAEYSARVQEQHGNEGDADAIRRSAIRVILGIRIGESMYATRKLQEQHRGN